MKHSPAIIVIAAVLLAALSRLLPHPPNFSPVMAMALFSGAALMDRRLALIVPLLAMLLADLILGFHGTMVFVYLAMALVVLGGRILGDKRGLLSLAAAGFGGALVFFIVSNAGVWLVQDMYSRDFAGLLACYGAALPFFHNSLIATLLYGGVFFGLEWRLRHQNQIVSAKA